MPLPLLSPTDDEAADTAADWVSDEEFDRPAAEPRLPEPADPSCPCPIKPVSGPAPLLAAPLSGELDAPPPVDGSDGNWGTVDFAAPETVEGSGARPATLPAAVVGTICISPGFLSPSELPDDPSGLRDPGGAADCPESPVLVELLVD